MSHVTFTFWSELSSLHQQHVVTLFGSLDHWLQMQRLRASSIVIAWDNQLPCGVSVISHDRIRVGAAIVDVATLRYSAKADGQADDLVVEMLMHQAQSLLAEGIGVVLVNGDVGFWSQYGFAPISLAVETRWPRSPVGNVSEPGTVRVGQLTVAEQALVRGMLMAQSGEDVALIESALPDLHAWLQIIGRDGQLRAAAQLVSVDSRVEVVRATASDDGSALDLVSALLEYVSDSQHLTIRLPQSHAVTRMAQELHAVTTVMTSPPQTIMAGVIDLPLMLESLKPAFRQRILASPYAQWSGGVRVEISDERAMIMFDNGDVRIIDGTREASLRIKHVEVAALAQMTFGYRSIGALRRSGMLFCDDTELSLCEAVFTYTAPTLVV
jgi:hypothetical protein